MDRQLTIDAQLKDLQGERQRALQKLIRHVSYSLSKQVIVKMFGSKDAAKLVNGMVIVTTLLANLPAGKGRM